MDKNDIYKLKYYKYKSKYLQLKNIYNQEGGVPFGLTGLTAFFLNKAVFEQIYKVNLNNLYKKDVIPSSKDILSLSYDELCKLPGIKTIIKTEQTIEQAIIKTEQDKKCKSTNLLKLKINDTINNSSLFFPIVNTCLITKNANYCLIFDIKQYGKNILKYVIDEPDWSQKDRKNPKEIETKAKAEVEAEIKIKQKEAADAATVVVLAKAAAAEAAVAAENAAKEAENAIIVEKVAIAVAKAASEDREKQKAASAARATVIKTEAKATAANVAVAKAKVDVAKAEIKLTSARAIAAKAAKATVVS